MSSVISWEAPPLSWKTARPSNAYRRAVRSVTLPLGRRFGGRSRNWFWGAFTGKVFGRVSAARNEKRYLGDATRAVLIEKW